MEGDINGEGQNFSEGGFVKILVGGGRFPIQTPPVAQPGFVRCPAALQKLENSIFRKKARIAGKTLFLTVKEWKSWIAFFRNKLN